MSKLFVVAMILLSVLSYINGSVLPEVAQIVNGAVVNRASVSAKKGLTFVKEDHLVKFGIDLIGCRNWSDSNGMNCDAYVGDTSCTELRPVLCVKVDNTPRPAYPTSGVGGATPAWFYLGWNRGHVATTVPVQGSQFINRAAVDSFCATSFGTGWRVAEFHDPTYIAGMDGTTYSGDSWTQNSGQQQSGGWHFYSYGDVRNDIRFWVHISDQPSTCWAQ